MRFFQLTLAKASRCCFFFLSFWWVSSAALSLRLAKTSGRHRFFFSLYFFLFFFLFSADANFVHLLCLVPGSAWHLHTLPLWQRVASPRSPSVAARGISTLSLCGGVWHLHALPLWRHVASPRSPSVAAPECRHPPEGSFYIHLVTQFLCLALEARGACIPGSHDVNSQRVLDQLPPPGHCTASTLKHTPCLSVNKANLLVLELQAWVQASGVSHLEAMEV